MEVIDLLCSSCREIHPIYPGGTKDDQSLEMIFGGYNLDLSNHAMSFVIGTLLDNLRMSSGCSMCIDSVEQYY